MKSGYICEKCALKLNATHPECHVCTVHTGICEFCKKSERLVHTSDWNWPDKKYLEANRET